jgi:hypothetical protein
MLQAAVVLGLHDLDVRSSIAASDKSAAVVSTFDWLPEASDATY